MEDRRMPKLLLRGRSRKWWLQDVEQDLRRMGIRDWKGNVHDRDEWREIVEEAKTNNRLYRQTGRKCHDRQKMDPPEPGTTSCVNQAGNAWIPPQDLQDIPLPQPERKLRVLIV
ncbi:hypothetical protein C0J52_09243 [Blattella germanica]|nr:hypothetical protein C0J52_09243 [Blattella germanica]